MEYNRQREHFGEKRRSALKRNIQKDVDMHATDNARLIRENVSLTKEINELRRESKDLAIQASAIEVNFGLVNGNGNYENENGNGRGMSGMSGIDPKPPTDSSGRRSKGLGMGGGGGRVNTGGGQEIEIQVLTIEKLQERVMQLQNMVAGDASVNNEMKVPEV